MLIAPLYGAENKDRRTHQTIQPLSEQLGVKIYSPYKEELEAELAKFVSQKVPASVVLISWEHHRIPAIGENIVGVVNRNEIPKSWPPKRFDLIWRFLREPAGYYFSILPQLLLPGDSHP